MKGPAIFLAQFITDEAPFNSLKGLCHWAASLGYEAIQIPTLDKRLIDLPVAAESKTYCDEWLGKIKEDGLEVSELSTHIQGQLVAVHPAYNVIYDLFAPSSVRGNSKARTEWAIEQMKMAARASAYLGLTAQVTFSGSLAWPYVYPWPQRPAGL